MSGRVLLLLLPLLPARAVAALPPAPGSVVRSAEGAPETSALPAVQEDSFLLLEGGRVTVAYGPGNAPRAQRILALLESFPPLPGLPPAVPYRVRVFLPSTDTGFDSLTGGRVPDWGAAVTLPARGWIVLPPPGSPRVRGWDERRILRHEWAHVALHDALQGVRVPRWFDEGYAQWASGGWTPGDAWRLRVALALGRTPPMDSLTLEWPRGRGQAEIAYLLAATAVEYLVGESGERGLVLFLDRWRRDGSFEKAFRQVYGVTTAQFEEDWRRYVRSRYGWLFVLSHSAVFWLLMALALLVLVRVRRGRDRAALAHLRATEPPDAPAFWGEEEAPPGTNRRRGRSHEGTGPGEEGES